MGRRTIAILVLLIGIIMLVVVGLFFLNSQDQPQPATDTPVVVTDESGASVTVTPEPGAPPPGVPDGAATLPPMVEVVVSLQTLPRGYQITEADLGTIFVTEMRLAGAVDSNVVTNLPELVGKYARTDIFQGQTITKDLFVGDLGLVVQEEYGPSDLIPPGFVAQAVPMDRLSGVAYGLAEGDYIDIMISFTFRELDPQFQTLLFNQANFIINIVDEEGNTTQTVVALDPIGRFEELPTGELAHIYPREDSPRPLKVSFVLQNAKVIQVGEWEPVLPVEPATPTPEPVGEGTPTPTFSPGAIPSPTASPPDVLLLALIPQQQLLLKYALETQADIDFALRGINDGQLYSIENVDFDYIVNRFGIEVPPNFNYTVDKPSVTLTPAGNTTAAAPTATPASGD